MHCCAPGTVLWSVEWQALSCQAAGCDRQCHHLSAIFACLLWSQRSSWVALGSDWHFEAALWPCCTSGQPAPCRWIHHPVNMATCWRQHRLRPAPQRASAAWERCQGSLRAMGGVCLARPKGKVGTVVAQTCSFLCWHHYAASVVHSEKRAGRLGGGVVFCSVWTPRALPWTPGPNHRSPVHFQHALAHFTGELYRWLPLLLALHLSSFSFTSSLSFNSSDQSCADFCILPVLGIPAAQPQSPRWGDSCRAPLALGSCLWGPCAPGPAGGPALPSSPPHLACFGSYSLPHLSSFPNMPP